MVPDEQRAFALSKEVIARLRAGQTLKEVGVLMRLPSPEVDKLIRMATTPDLQRLREDEARLGVLIRRKHLEHQLDLATRFPERLARLKSDVAQVSMEKLSASIAGLKNDGVQVNVGVRITPEDMKRAEAVEAEIVKDE